jgi:hypothetical protein
VEQVRKKFFFEKKNQKTSIRLRVARGTVGANG